MTGLFLIFLLPLPALSAVDYDLIPAPDSHGRWGYVDAKTKKTVIAPQYHHVTFFRGRAAIVTDAAGKKGLIDRQGNIILPLEYDAVAPAIFSGASRNVVNGFFIVRQEALTGVIRPDGNWVLPLGKNESIRFFSSADQHAYFTFDGSFWINGRIYTPPAGFVISRIIRGADAFMIESASRSSPGMPEKGVMLPDGSILVKPEYDEIQFIAGPQKRWVVSKVDSGVLGKVIKAVATGGDIDMDEKKDLVTFWLLDEKGEAIRKYRGRYHPFVKDGRLSYESGGEAHEINPVNGDLLIRDTTRKAGSQYVLFQERGFWGVRNNAGEVLIEPQYVSIETLGGDLFAARKIEGLDTSGQAPEYNASIYDENTGVVNIANQVVMPFEYAVISSLRYPDRETAPLMIGRKVPVGDGQHKDRRYGMAERSGRVIIPPQYLNGFYMNRIGHAQVYRDGRHGVIDHTGKVILPLAYRSLFDTASLDKTTETFYMAEKDRLWGVYDASGKEIVPFEYGFLFISENDIKKGWVKGDSPDRRKRGAYNYRTGVRIPPLYDDIRIHDHVLTTYRRPEGQDVKAEKDVLDLKGKRLATYHHLEPLASGRFIAGKDRLNGVLDSKGKGLVSLKYRSLEKAGGNLLWAQNEGHGRFLVSETGEEYRIRD